MVSEYFEGSVLSLYVHKICLSQLAAYHFKTSPKVKRMARAAPSHFTSRGLRSRLSKRSKDTSWHLVSGCWPIGLLTVKSCMHSKHCTCTYVTEIYRTIPPRCLCLFQTTRVIDALTRSYTELRFYTKMWRCLLSTSNFSMHERATRECGQRYEARNATLVDIKVQKGSGMAFCG